MKSPLRSISERQPRILTVLISGAMVILAPTGRASDPSEISFDRDVRPILSSRCYACHGPDDEHREAGLRLDDRDQATAVLESGLRAIVPGDPARSTILHRVTSRDSAQRMPPEGKDVPLTPKEVDLLRRWIEQGANVTPHWSFVSPVWPTYSTPIDRWCDSVSDLFVLDRLRNEGMTVSPKADRFVWARRLALDILGLPPTTDEVDRFVNDESADAEHRLVDRFLASPAYGERWGRVWLDLARYADSTGYASDPLRPNMWRYRDWVIESLNANMPFDQFTLEQLAGDLIPMATTDQTVATGFHRNTMTNGEGGTDDEEFRVVAVKDRANTTFQVWMGLTLGCAQCHSHKYDPITHEEYYRVYAFFNQTADTDKPDDEPTIPAPTASMRDEIARIDDQVAALRSNLSISPEQLAREQSDWEASLAMTTPWQQVEIDSFRSAAGASLEKIEDGSIRANDAMGVEETYTVEATLSTGGWTGLQLEALADKTLPLGGPGRASNGGFVLSRLLVDVADASAVDQKVAGRFIRVDLSGSGRILSLAEVEVIAGDQNVARTGRASQKSTDYGGAPIRAIDGVTNGDYFAASSVTHTATDDNPWWEVKLTKDETIDRIVIWNRTDGASGDRLAGAVVSILDADRRPVWSQVLAEPPATSVTFEPGPWRNVPLANAWATFEQTGLPVLHAVRSDNVRQKGWGISPKYSQSQTAWFVFASPALQASSVKWRVTLQQFFPQRNHTIGRFRLAVSRDPSLTRRAGVPKDVLDIIDRPSAERSADELARLVSYYQQIAPSLVSVREAIARLEASKPVGPKLPIMRELAPGERRVTRVMAKGNFLAPGNTVEPGVPAFLPPLPASQPLHRQTLARWLTTPEHPLTGRVTVNRIWARLLGRGLVETEEDFGTQGELPTHPEVLDALAIDFVDRGFDMKRTLSEIVTSSTYRQSSVVRPSDFEKDPANRWLARFPRQRLDAETVRDQALTLSGVRSTKMLGPSVYPFQPPGLWQAAFNGSDRNWTTSPGEDRVRRGVYTFWRRTIPYPSMAVFDAPSRELCTLRRPSTNTPLQAFVTLNDPVYVEAAQWLGRRIAREAGPSPVDRVRLGWRIVLGRPTDEKVIASLVRLYEDELQMYRKDLGRAIETATEPVGPLPAGLEPAEGAALTALGNVLLNLDAVLTKG
ncbi:DUF1553 domain-containing protein [bacterium]|nr:DUF1553 domain-containing protein [bacterium]